MAMLNYAVRQARRATTENRHIPRPANALDRPPGASCCSAATGRRPVVGIVSSLVNNQLQIYQLHH